MTQKIYILNTSAEILGLRKIVFITNKCISDVCRMIFSNSAFTDNWENSVLSIPELYKKCNFFRFLSVHCKLKTYWEKYYIGATGTGLSR
jgi:hypothetical protein